jgi:hypothetical protein
MTNPCGRSFLSYRRVRHAEAAVLIAAQHDLGIPTWRDMDDLDEVPTEDQIREVLADPETANAILWITPEVGNADFIRKIEAPLILERARRDKDFFMVPVLAGGIVHADAALAIDPRISLEELKYWNLRKAAGDPIDDQEAAEIAGRVLQRRIETLQRLLPQDAPLKIAFYTRTKAPVLPDNALTLDWSARFGGFKNREAAPETWSGHLLPALEKISSTLLFKAPGRSVEVHGLVAIPAAFALGHAFMAPRPTLLSWVQRKEGLPTQLWNLEARREPSGFTASTRSHDPGGKDLAVLVSVADSAEESFTASLPDLPRFRAILNIHKPGTTRNLVESSGQAVDIAYTVTEAIRQERRTYRDLECIHLFLVVPVGLAMLIGQLSNTLGPIQTYEHLEIDTSGRYRPAARLNAEGKPPS